MISEIEAAALWFPEPFQLRVVESSESTNSELRQLGMAGAPDGLVLVALEQTAGRGRRGNGWF
ncbi:MAG: hypothetical protein ACO3RV_03640 [Luteolibacter sp.]